MAAASHEGQCLAEAYVNNRTQLLWRCSLGHTWSARPDHVLEGHWCPYCQEWSGETSCRRWLENYFSKPFPKLNPSWLRGSKGYPLQLDGYNEELKLAFEYHGAQHYRYTPWFHKTPEEYAAQLRRDREKAVLCAARGTHLLVIPYNRRPVGPVIEAQLTAFGFGRKVA